MLVHHYFMKVFCICTRSRNKNGIGTTHTVALNMSQLKRTSYYCENSQFNWEIRGNKNERMAVGGVVEPVRRGSHVSR